MRNAKMHEKMMLRLIVYLRKRQSELWLLQDLQLEQMTHPLSH